MIFEAGDAGFVRVAANNLHEEIGSFGEIPPKDQFEVREIGPDEDYGWIATTGWMGQGISISSTNVYARVDDTIKLIGTLPAHFDDQGNCENGKLLTDGGPCSDYDFEIGFDTKLKSDRFYPALLGLRGNDQGTKTSREYTSRFDPLSFPIGKIDGLPQAFAEGN